LRESGFNAKSARKTVLPEKTYCLKKVLPEKVLIDKPMQHPTPQRLQNQGPCPKVSVIIPTYNRSEMLKQAIDSVLAQGFDDFELIVVDDGSTDNTEETLAACKGKIIYCRQENRGVSAARNRGIGIASGELIAFLDSDDLWLPGKLSCQVDFFNSHPDALICQTQEAWIRNGRRVNPKNRHQKESGMIYERSLALCLVSPSAVMMKKQLFDMAGVFDENLPACEDYDLWLRISCRFPIHLIDIPLIIKRGGHKDQLSGAAGLDRFRIFAISKMIASGLLSKAQKKASVEMLIKKCAIYANGCEKRGKIREALEYTDLAKRWEDRPASVP
jgi:glycosyltransferase involved in cell wall biosynthesis